MSSDAVDLDVSEAHGLPADPAPPGLAAGSLVSGRRPRTAALDVARAVALVGVFVQNYVVAFNLYPLRTDAWPDAFHGWLARLTDYSQGPLTTRFAAALVTIFGIGLTLLGSSSEFSRWTPVRRGLLLFVGGMWFNTAWPGTILPFYGMYLVILGPFARVTRRAYLLVAAVGVTVVTFAVRLWIFLALDADRGRLSRELAWLAMRDERGSRLGLSNPRGFVASMLYWGAHPLLPWLAFVLVGMWVGRTPWKTVAVQRRLVAVGLAMVAVGYIVASVMTRQVSGKWAWAWSTTLSSPYFDNPVKYDAPLYVLVTVGSSVAGIGLVLLAASRFPSAWVTRRLSEAGRVTLSIYVLHGLIPAAMFRWWLDRPSLGVGWAVLVALAAWVVAMAVGSWWVRGFRMGPLEDVLRRFSGDGAHSTELRR